MKLQQVDRRNHEEFGMENAVARYVRNRWPKNTVCHVQQEFDLDEGRARGVVYATGSRATINAMLKHPNGGWRLGILILEGVVGHSLENFLEHERAVLNERAARLEADREAADRLSARLRDIADLPAGPGSGSADRRTNGVHRDR